MAITYPTVLSVGKTINIEWTQRDTMLYSLAVGAGADPMDQSDLRYVTEFDLQVLPTMATTLALHASPAPLTGLDYAKSVHAAQSLTMHKMLPATGKGQARSRVLQVQDMGPGRSAVFLFESLLTGDDGDPIATLRSTAFARGDGGFGGPDLPLPPAHCIPDRPADAQIIQHTRPDQALLYRLTGDYNPLHAVPTVAHAAGFQQPILHGLCTYGFAARAVIKVWCDQQADRLLHHEARFSAPVIPGDRLVIDMWKEGPTISFEVRVPDRDVIVIRHGRSEIKDS